MCKELILRLLCNINYEHGIHKNQRDNDNAPVKIRSHRRTFNYSDNKRPHQDDQLFYTQSLSSYDRNFHDEILALI